MKSRYIAPLYILFVSMAAVSSAADAETSRQQKIEQRGAAVMPFDQGRTTHFFDDTATGGIETVTANDTSDREQVSLIRAHLAVEAKRFARGDFSDPAKIHGMDMSGLSALANAGNRLTVRYEERPAGASLIFASGNKAVIAAIHDWFAAQRSDHAAHRHRHP